MTPTYYTPEIEEFCVGFVCEHKSYIRGALSKWIEQWDTKIINETDFERDSYHRICSESVSNFRVKHLDREDIEGEGWKATSGFYEEGDIEIKYCNDALDAALIMYRDGSIRISGGTNKPEFLFFHGKIKNLTEFRKLMKQLGIK